MIYTCVVSNRAHSILARKKDFSIPLAVDQVDLKLKGKGLRTIDRNLQYVFRYEVFKFPLMSQIWQKNESP